MKVEIKGRNIDKDAKCIKKNNVCHLFSIKSVEDHFFFLLCVDVFVA